jgi:Secretion system C-terminal sorting domain
MKNPIIYLFIAVFLPFSVLAQGGIRISGNLKMQASGCVKMYVVGKAEFSDSSQLSGEAELQATKGIEGKNQKYFINCVSTSDSCVIGFDIDNRNLDFWLGKPEIGQVKIEYFTALGQLICEFYREKTTHDWFYDLDPYESNYLPFVVRLSLNGKVMCSQKTSTRWKNTCMLLHPNPATSELNIRLEDDMQSEEAVFWIVNMQGQVVYNQPSIKKDKGNWTIDISKLLEGMYVLQIQTEKGICRQKFVKM